VARRLIVTDIDSTISNARRRLEAVLRRLGRVELLNQGQRYRGWVQEQLAGAEREAFLRWFLSDLYLELDEPLPGAAATLRELSERGIMVVYLTGRHDTPGDSMRAGTERWLREHGFPAPDPDGERARLVMKPQRGLDDQEFKTAALEEITGWGEVLAGIGDRPEDARAYAAHGIPPLRLCNEFHSPEELKRAAEGVRVVRDWAELRAILFHAVPVRAVLKEG